MQFAYTLEEAICFGLGGAERRRFISEGFTTDEAFGIIVAAERKGRTHGSKD